jgi:hypothetical protein
MITLDFPKTKRFYSAQKTNIVKPKNLAVM